MLSGASGHIGFAVLVEALAKGYAVRALVRSEAKAQAIRSATAVQPHLDRLSVVVVEDFLLSPGGFDDALTGVDYVIHSAARLLNFSMDHTDIDAMENQMIKPHVDGTWNLLRAALKQPSIKKVVLTAGATAVLPPLYHTDTTGQVMHAVLKDITTPDSKPPHRSPRGPFVNPFEVYNVAKQLTRERVEEFIETESPPFDVIQVIPSVMFGPIGLATSPVDYFTSSNGIIMAPLLGFPLPGPIPGMICHLDDVSYVHVAALDPKIQGNQNFAINQHFEQTVDYADAKRIAKKWFPEAVEQGLLPCTGEAETFYCPVDATRTEEAFGIKFRGFEEMVRYAVQGYLDLVERQQEQGNGTSVEG